MHGQPGVAGPLHRRAVQRLRLAGNDFADEEFQVDGFFRVVVGDFREQPADGDCHAQLLTDFADEALLKGFARLALAAGKFPQPAQMRTGVALGDQELAVAEDERGADLMQFSVFNFEFLVEPEAELLISTKN